MMFDAASLFGSGALAHFNTLSEVLHVARLEPGLRSALCADRRGPMSRSGRPLPIKRDTLDPGKWLGLRGWTHNSKSIFEGGDWIMPGSRHDFDLNGALANEFINTVTWQMVNPSRTYQLEFLSSSRPRLVCPPLIHCIQVKKREPLAQVLTNRYLSTGQNPWRWFARHVLAMASKPPILMFQTSGSEGSVN